MSSQADVRSVEALKDLRVAVALFAEDTLSALGSVDMEVKRTVQWLQHDRRAYWQDQIKRRREQVASARAEVFRRRLAKTAENSPAHSEQKELLRKAEAGLRDAETRAAMVKAWEPALQQAALEYRAAVQRIKSMAAGDAPRAMAALERMIEALEAYARVAPSGGPGAPPPLDAIAEAAMNEEPGQEQELEPEPEPPV